MTKVNVIVLLLPQLLCMSRYSLGTKRLSYVLLNLTSWRGLWQPEGEPPEDVRAECAKL